MDRDIVHKHIYPVLGKKLNEAFPEFRFRPYRPGWWVAQDAPEQYADYGHKEGKLIANGWGFCSYKGKKADIPWLSYLNGGSWPRDEEFWAMLKVLCEIAEVSLPEEELNEEQQRQIEETARRPSRRL